METRQKKYYQKNKEELTKKRMEKYYNNRENFVLIINNEYYLGRTINRRYKTTRNIKEARIFKSKNALNNIINKYNLKESEVRIINV